MPPARTWALAALLSLAVSSVSAQRPGPPPPEAVRLDVVATDSRGQVVPDLGRGEFEIVEGDSLRPVEDVRFVPATAPRPGPGDDEPAPITNRRDEQEAAAESGVRLFGIYLDEYHVTAGAGAARARDELADLVRGLSPRDLVAVFRPLDSVLTIRMMRDREAAARAIEAFDPRRDVFEPRNAFEQYFIGGGRERIESVRAQISTSAISALTAHLGGLGGGPKTLIVLSEGFDRGPRRRGDDLPTITNVLRVAARTSVVIYAIDPRVWDEVPPPPLPPPPASGTDGDGATAGDPRRLLVELVGETGGAAILQPSDLSTTWPRLAADMPGHYVLTFRGADDGRFHPVTVRVTRRGVEARTRPGYWATSAAERLAAGYLAEDRAPKPPPEPVRRLSPLIRPWFGLTRGADGQTRVRFVWEPAPRVPGNRSRAPAPARVTMKATQADGTAVFEGVVGAATPSATPAGNPLQAVFDAAPGRLLIQMTIEDAVAQVLDVDVRDVAVSALTAPVVLGTPQVWRARNAREFRALQENPEAAPSAAREFSRAERLLIRVPAFGAEAPLVNARLLSRLGVAMRDLPLSTGGDGTRDVDLPLAGFAVGDYVIEFHTRDAGRDVKEAVRFRVVP